MKMLLSYTMLCLMLLSAACSAPKAKNADSSASSADTAAATSQAMPKQVTIAMVGDIMMGNTWPHDRLPVDDGKHLFSDAAPFLQKADIACGNLEGVIAPPEMGAPRKNPKSKMAFMFKMPPRYVDYLKEAGFDFLSLANNHIYDFFSDPITYTEKVLTEAGIGFAGAKDPQKKEGHTFTAYKTVNGVTYGYAAFSVDYYTARLQDYDLVKSIIKELRAKSDVVLINFHGGNEGKGVQRLPHGEEIFYGESRGNIREFTHLCIDAGADVVFGSGPHVVRAVELYKGHFIAYSLGNFCTCGMGINGLNGLAPCITVVINPANGTFQSGTIHAFRQQYMAGPKADKSGQVIQEIRNLTQADISNSTLRIANDGSMSIK
ncbi:MAG: CapA family protein [Sodaliphilus sp.]